MPGWLVATAFTGAVFLGTRPSLADPQAQTQAASLFVQGRALRKGGDCAAALPLFQKAYQIYPDGLGSLRNTAECEEELSHPASAYEAWMALKQALVTRTEQKYAGWDRDAENALARLAPLVAPSKPQPNAPSKPDAHPAASLAPVATSRTDAPPAAPLPPRSTGDVEPEVAPPPTATSSVPGAPLTTRAAVRSSDNSAARTAGWVAVGIGAASAVGFSVTLALRQSALAEIHSDCDPHYTCSSAYQATLTPVYNRGWTANLLMDVFGGIAVVGAATGVVLLTIVPSRSVTAALRVSPSGVAATGSF